MARWSHSIPTWTMGPRGANFKFQAGVVLAGIPKVSDRLATITRLSRRIKTLDGEPLLTSLHLLHELKTANLRYKKYNSPNAISMEELIAGISSGRYPRILAITAPAFGFKGVENGAILSPDPDMVRMARDLHSEAIDVARTLAIEGMGNGVVIWWPAFDSRLLDRLDRKPLPFREAWKRLKAFWVEVLDKRRGMVWLEWKPSDPGADYICTLALAIRFCNEVNKELGRVAMFINNEWAHLLIGGTTVEEGTARTFGAGLFTGFVHVNSAQILPMSIEKMLEDGFPIESISAGYDSDWAVGTGGEARWSDQQRAVRLMDTCGVETILAEHDINPAGQDPIKFAEMSILNLEKMLKAARRKKAQN